jgi:hypothetical protein
MPEDFFLATIWKAGRGNNFAIRRYFSIFEIIQRKITGQNWRGGQSSARRTGGLTGGSAHGVTYPAQIVPNWKFLKILVGFGWIHSDKWGPFFA